MEVAKWFIERAAEEQVGDGKFAPDKDFKDFYRLAIRTITDENVAEVSRIAESPIERTFLNSDTILY